MQGQCTEPDRAARQFSPDMSIYKLKFHHPGQQYHAKLYSKRSVAIALPQCQETGLNKNVTKLKHPFFDMGRSDKC